MKYRIIRIIALLVILIIVFVPFLSDKDGLIAEEGQSVKIYSFMDMIEDAKDSHSSKDELRPDVLYYIACPMCALFILLGAFVKISGYCTSFSVLGMIILLYILYEFSSKRWYIGLQEAYLTFGYYITCIGFVSMFIVSLWEKRE